MMRLERLSPAWKLQDITSVKERLIVYDRVPIGMEIFK